MGDYKYINDYEKEEIRKYAEGYSFEEVELNKKLYDECSKENIDFSVVEDLLKQGADPNGRTAEYGRDVLLHIYGELVMESQDSDRATIIAKIECSPINFKFVCSHLKIAV